MNTDNNVTANNVTASCLTSSTNKWNLDNNGNLSVKSIVVADGLPNQTINMQTIFNAIYPVGTIYFTINAQNPSFIFGGTWVSWGSGRVPVGVSSGETEFNSIEKTGGEKTHLLNIQEMPSHQHLQWLNYRAFTGFSPANGGYKVLRRTSPDDSVDGGDYHQTTWVGDSHAHNNLQPYITCYMWKRTA